MAVRSLCACEFQQIEFFHHHCISSFRNHKIPLPRWEGNKGRGMVRRAHHDHPEHVEGSPSPPPSPVKGEGDLESVSKTSKKTPFGRGRNSKPKGYLSDHGNSSYLLWGLPKTSSKKASSTSLPSAIFWRYLMKSMVSAPVIFLLLKAPNPR